MDPLKMQKFDGNISKMDFEAYETRILAIGALKDGFDTALLKDLPITLTTIPPDPVIETNQKLRKIAMGYLVLTLDGPPLNLVKGCQNPYDAWKLLVAKYKPQTIDEYARLNSQLESTELDDPYEDPEVWFTNILKLNSRLASIKASYGKEDLQIISHVLSKLPRELYELFITNYEINGFSKVPLHVFQTKLQDFWSRHVKNKTDNIVMTLDQAKPAAKEEDKGGHEAMNNLNQQVQELRELMTTMKQETQRKDPAAWGVRMCTTCGRAGHDANYCRSGPGRGGGGRGFFNQPPRLCHNCGQPGHLQFNCPINPRHN